MDKVYLLVMDWAFEGDRGIDIEVFTTKAKAVKALRVLVSQERNDSWIGEDNGIEISIEEENEWFKAIEVGNEADVRTEIYIEEKDVKG